MPYFNSKSISIPGAGEALPGRDKEMPLTDTHYINGNPLKPPFPDNHQLALFGLGCFWGAERKFWQLEGVHSTSVGYAAGHTPNPDYQEVCSGRTGHNEVVRVVFNPEIVNYDHLLRIFWQSHNPTQGMQQGNDVGTQYRSGIYVYDEEQRKTAVVSRGLYQHEISNAGFGQITTEILDAPLFYYAEDYHQQYLAKNPAGYCGLGGIDVNYPMP